MHDKNSLNWLPEGLPEPQDDGACDHLLGMKIPSVVLKSTQDNLVNLEELDQQFIVVYIYPMTGAPDNELFLSDEWKNIPGACGCTSQSCGFRDQIDSFSNHGAVVFGLSNNTPEYQKEAAERLELPFELLSDEGMEFSNQLNLPTFAFANMNLLKRITLILHRGKIVYVMYPIFPSNENAKNVLEWLEEHSSDYE